MPYALVQYESTAATSISSNVWYRQIYQQTGAPFPIIVSSTMSETGPLYNVIVTQSSMFIPTGYGFLFYHDIPTAVSPYRPPEYPPLPRPRPLARPALLRGRRALRRSIDLFRMLRPADEVRTFLSGDPLIIRGRSFDYRVQKRDNLLQHTMHPRSAHIPYDLQLLDKSGKSLARGCMVIYDTPVIDQLVALILNIEHDETKVLNNTNWSPPLSLPLAA